MTRCSQYVLVCVLAIVGLITSTGELAAQQKTPIPDEQAQQVSQKVAGDLYGGRFRQARTMAGRRRWPPK